MSRINDIFKETSAGADVAFEKSEAYITTSYMLTADNC